MISKAKQILINEARRMKSKGLQKKKEAEKLLKESEAIMEKANELE